MLNLWLVVLLGFVASARGEGGGRLYSFMSHEAVEKQFKDTCMTNPNIFTPSELQLPTLSILLVSLPSISSITSGVVGSVTVNNVSLSKDFSVLFVSITVTLSCNEVKNLQLLVLVNLNLIWSTSLDGCLQAIAADLTLTITLQLGSVGLIPNALANVLLEACRPLFKTHFGTCFKGILGIFNENLKSGGALVYDTLLETVATGVIVINGALSAGYEVRTTAGTLINYPSNTIDLLLQTGDIWGCSFNAAQLAFLWNYVPKTSTRKWSTCLLQAHFGLDLGSYVDITVSLKEVVSVNINSSGINISATARVVITSEHGVILLELNAIVDLSVNLTARGGRIGLDFISLSLNSWAVTSQNIGCTCNDVLSSVKADLNIFLGLAIDEFVGDFGRLFPPGVPRCYQVNNKPSAKCYDSQGEKESFCSVIYREAS